jgi:uncharacterized protein (DUF302 family)
MNTHGTRRHLRVGFDEALERVPAALQAEGFGVLTRIDVRDALQKKLGVEFRRYQILGACNPPLAHEALKADLEVGLLLPCNVIVYEGDDGQAVVAAVDPLQTLAGAGGPALEAVARSVREKLGRVLDRLEEAR